ncbi:MAG TPA: DUF3240 family protein [Methylotenera sp.]|nr:DUF3240 family protein [Methylotenera sp.]
MQENAAQALLILIVPPKLEEVLVDFLLQQTSISGFTTAHANGHGTGHIAGYGSMKLSLLEQVTGRQSRMQFMVHATLPVMHGLIGVLKAEFQHTDMHYILLPVLDAQSI